MKNFKQTLPNTNISFNMIHIEEGTFDMGSNELPDSQPIHKVKLSEFWLSEVPVTQTLWTAVMGTNPSYFKGANRPVEQVSWDDIMNRKKGFLVKLNKFTEGVREKSSKYRLPTEAEWEYAARGGKYAKKFFSDHSGSAKLDEVGWYYANSHGETKPVGLKVPNFLGLYDMSGNVWEWGADVYHREFYKNCHQQDTIKNPRNRGLGSRIIRGGSWLDRNEGCRSTYRGIYLDSNSFHRLGFRLVLSFPVQKRALSPTNS